MCENEIIILGISDDSFERMCSHCGTVIEGDSLNCGNCGKPLQYLKIEDIPKNDWFNWVRIQKKDYDARDYFNENKQKYIQLSLSCGDIRGSDIGLEITQNNKGQILVKVENSESFTYFPYQHTKIMGNYTVITFGKEEDTLKEDEV